MSRRSRRSRGELVLTSMPSPTGKEHAATGLRMPSTSTMHTRQAPTRLRSGW